MRTLFIILSLSLFITSCVVQTPYSYPPETSYNRGYYRTYYYVPIYQGQYTTYWGTTNPSYNPRHPYNSGYRSSYYTNRYERNQPLPQTNYTPQRQTQTLPRSNQNISINYYGPRNR